MNRVSIVIPAFNAAAYIEESVDSVLAQTHPDIELIVVDDGSTDGTLEVLRRYGSRLVLLTQAAGGPYSARNRAATVATGEWLAFLDADDSWLPTKIEKQLAVSGQRVGLIHTDRFNVGERGSLPWVQGDLQPLVEGDVFLDLLLTGNTITTSSVMVKKSVFDGLGGFAQLARAEDWHMWLRIAEHHQVRAVREPLVRYRFHAGNVSRDLDLVCDCRLRVVREALTLDRGRALPPRVRRQIWSSVWATNGWDARRRHEWRHAAWAYLRALSLQPHSRSALGGLARAILMRD